MMPSVRFGTINSGSTVISAVVGPLGPRKSVMLTTDYSMEHPGGDGLAGAWPTRPFLTGVSPQPAFPYLISSGTTIELLGCEADALVAASAADYA